MPRAKTKSTRAKSKPTKKKVTRSKSKPTKKVTQKRSTSRKPKAKAPKPRTTLLRDIAALKREDNYKIRNKRLKQEGKGNLTRKAPAVSARLTGRSGQCGLIGMGIDKKKWICKPQGMSYVWRKYTGALKIGQLDRSACRLGGASSSSSLTTNTKTKAATKVAKKPTKRTGGARNGDGVNEKEGGGATKKKNVKRGKCKDLGMFALRSKSTVAQRLKACKVGSMVMANGRKYRVVKSLVAL